MKRFLFLLLAVASTAGASRQLLLADSGTRELKLVDLKTETVQWKSDGIYCYDIHRLPSGNILYCDEQNKKSGKSHVRETTPDGKVVWEYTATGEVYSCQRLPDGSTLVAECSNGRLVVADANGAIAIIIPLTFRKGGHGTVRWARQTDSGNYVAAHLGDRCLREYDDTGKVIRTIPCPWPVFGVAPLPNGHLLASGKDGLIEIDQDSNVAWELKKNEVPAIGIKWLCGLYPKENGNILVCNWLGHEKEGKGIPIFEISRDKQVVWSLPASIQTQWISAVAE